MPSPQQDDFFVGYRATPAVLRPLLRAIVAFALLTAVLAAAAISSPQRNPGDGIWESDERDFTGTLLTDPYPMLQLPNGGGTLVFVGVGKVAVELPAPAVTGDQLRAHGTVLHRGGLRLLEVERLERLNVPPVATIAEHAGAEQAFHGEVVDPKCFSGAMKPGTGKTHKSCAALCLRGGIPPAFVTDQGETFLLSGIDRETAVELVGELVELQGAPVHRGGIQILQVTKQPVRASNFRRD